MNVQAIAVRGKEVPPQERIQMLHSLLSEFNVSDDVLHEDPLYKIVKEVISKTPHILANSKLRGQ
jgi:hypothetical protein